MAEYDAANHRYVPRSDAVMHRGRMIVPTIYGEREGNTKWLSNMDEFRAAGGMVGFNEDQTEITLHAPVGYKFGVGFFRKD